MSRPVGSERAHTDREYEAELAALRTRTLEMALLVRDAFAASVRAFLERDVDAARAMLENDAVIDALELELDERCVRILARRQPVASDLRLVTTVLKSVTDLERIGDQAVNVCERTVELSGRAYPLPKAIERMGEVALAMLDDASRAFETGGVELARDVVERDCIVDACHAQAFPEILSTATMTPEGIVVAQQLQSVARYIERVADHATNVAEMVVFMVRGEDVRHSFGARGT